MNKVDQEMYRRQGRIISTRNPSPGNPDVKMIRNPSFGNKRVFGKEISNLPEAIAS